MKKLAIVGSHPATRQNAPFDDPDFEIWLFNEAPQKPEIYKRWDNAFQMHKPEVYASSENWVNEHHWTWLQKDHGDRVIWMMERDERVPNSKKYPLDEVLAQVPYKYLRSTPAMALALGIYLGYEYIALYGSELSSNTEYGYQAINYAFWIGYALGKGVDLDLQCWQNEFNQPVYGYEGETQIPKDFFQQRIDDLATAARVNKRNLERMEDKINGYMVEFKPDKVGELAMKMESLALKAGEAQGALNEAYRYQRRTNPISRQEYERVCAQAQKDGDEKSIEMHKTGGTVEYVWNVWRQTANVEARNQLKAFLEKKNEETLETGRLLGVFRENAQYMAKYDELVTAAGGPRALQLTRGPMLS